MPSQKPRLNVTLDDDMALIIAKLAKLMGKSKAGLVNDLLVEMKPVLIDLSNALQDVQDKKNALPHLAKMSALANHGTANINNEMADFLNQIDWVDEK